MLIPLGTDRPIRRPSVVTPALILLCTAAYVVQVMLKGSGREDELLSQLWVIGGEGGVAGTGVYRAVTYAFLHGGLLHLAGNMLFLWVFGRPVEDRLGRLGFLMFYLGGAAAGGLVHAWLEPGPAIGASGAVSAVTGAFLVLFPRTKIRVLWFFILISILMAPAWFFIGLQIAWNVLAETTGSTGNIAVTAHLGGYAFGFGVAAVLLATGALSREPYDLFSISKHAKRRREFRAAARIAEPTVRSKKRAETPLDVRTEAVARDRAAVSTALSKNDMDDATGAYRLLIERHAASRDAVTLARNAQYRIGTHLATIGDDAMAIRAFDDFLGAYPRDPETGQIRILLARLCLSIGATGRAKRLLAEAVESARDDSIRALAETELASLGADGGTTDSPSSPAASAAQERP